MFKVTTNDAVNNSSSPKKLLGPTDDDLEKTVATSRFAEGKPTKELSDYAEELCEDSDEDPQNADLAREIVNGESFILHGEMTIANEEEPTSRNSEENKTKKPLPRQNPLLSLHRNRVAARVIEESMAEAEVVDRGPPPPHLPPHRHSPAVSRRKSFGNNAPKHPKQPPKPPVVDLSASYNPAIKKSTSKSTFIYSPTTYSRARALMEPSDPPLQVRPSCHFYGTKRIQNQANSLTRQSAPVCPKPSLQPSPKQSSQHPIKRSPQHSPKTKILPSPMKPRPPQSSPFTKRSPISGMSEPKQSPLNPPRVITIEPDSTSSHGPVKNAKLSSGSRKGGNKDRSGLSLLDDDVFEYTPSPPTSSSNYEKLVKNEDRYSKYELGKMANDRHKKLFHKTAELNEKLKEIKDLEKKMSRMKGNVTKLTNELKEKNRVLETQSTELLDLEGSKSDCEIFINKLKDDLEGCQKKLDAKTKEVDSANKRYQQAEVQLDEQRRLHQNLSLAHSATLQKIKDMVEERRKTDLLHTAQIQDKDVLIRKLEQGLAQKMATVSELVKDKRNLELLVLKQRSKNGSGSDIAFNLKAPGSSDLEDVKIDLDNTLQDTKVESEEEGVMLTTNNTKPTRTNKRGAGIGRGISAKQLATMSPRGRGSRARPLRKRLTTRSARKVINVESDSTDTSPLTTRSPKTEAARAVKKTNSPTTEGVKPECTTSPITSTPRTRVKSALSLSGRKRVRSLIAGGKRTPAVRKRSKSEVVPTPETEVSGKRKRKPACRYSPSENKMVPITDSPVNFTPDPETVSELEQYPGPVNSTDNTSSLLPTDNAENDKLTSGLTENLDENKDKSSDNAEEKADSVENVESRSKDGVTLVLENEVKIHSEYSKAMITAIEYDTCEMTSCKDEPFTEKEIRAKREIERRHIEVPSFREMSPLMLIHQEGEQASSFSKLKEGDSLTNYTRMHKKCETAEIRMMKQCERMRVQLEQRNNRKKQKEPPKIPSIIRELYCRNKEHPMSISKCKHPCVSVFKCPLPLIKQKDFTLPWANEIKSFAYYAKSSSSRTAPDPTVTLNPGATLVETPQPPASKSPSPNSQITLIFSQSESGIVVKEDETVNDEKTDILSVCPPVESSGSLEQLSLAVKSTNIWSNIQTTIASNLESSLSKNIFSKFGELRNTSSSGESSSRDNESVTCKRDRSSTDSNERSPSKLPKIGVERRNIWESWCSTARTQLVSDQPSSSTSNQRMPEPPNSLQTADQSTEKSSDSTDSPEGFDQKSFLLDACSSKERSPTLPPQPLTRKLEKLSKHKRPVLVCTNSSNSSPRPSDDSFDSSPAKT